MKLAGPEKYVVTFKHKAIISGKVSTRVLKYYGKPVIYDYLADASKMAAALRNGDVRVATGAEIKHGTHAD